MIMELPGEIAVHPLDCGERDVDLELMRSLVTSRPDLLNRLQAHNRLPLHHACKALHVPCVELLLSLGARPSSVCPLSNNNAVYYTVLSERPPRSHDKILKVLKLLLKYRQSHEKLYRFEANFSNDFSRFIELRLNSIVSLLLQNGEFIENLLPENDFPKMYTSCSGFFAKAVLSKNRECLKTLILHGFEVSNYILRDKKFYATPCKIMELFKDLAPLRLFWNFGGNVATNHQAYGLDRPLTNLSHGLDDYSPELIEEIEHMMTTPLSLKALCRFNLWRTLNKHYWWKIHLFCLPRELHDYLALKDL